MEIGEDMAYIILYPKLQEQMFAVISFMSPGLCEIMTPGFMNIPTPS